MASDKLRGWVRISTRHAERTQKRALEQHGCAVIYTSALDTIDDLIGSLRAGDVVVVTTLARLAASRSELRRVVEMIHSRRGVVLETTTGRRSDDRDALVAMLLDAVDELAGDRRVHDPEAAKRYGEKGGLAKGKAARAARTPYAEAIVPWRDLSLTAEQAIATPAMAGWTIRTAYRPRDEGGLGKRNTARGAKVGRPRAKKP